MSHLPGFIPWPEQGAHRDRELGYWTGETLGAMLRRGATEHPDRIAIVCGKRRWSYAELDAKADQLAAGFARLGIAAQDKVVVQLPNVAEFFSVCFGLFRLGALPVFALPAHRRAEIGHFCRFADAKAYVIADSDGGFDYRPLPQLAPTLLCRIRAKDVVGRKAFDKGLLQLVQEGTVQAVEVMNHQRERCVAAVGRLQFEVLQHRLQNEYGVETALSIESFACSAWLDQVPEDLSLSYAVVCLDSRGRHLALFRSEFDMRCARQRYPSLELADVK